MSEYRVQSIVLEKDMIVLQEAIDWIGSHSDKVKHIEETDTQYHFRQLEPNRLKRKGYNVFIAKRLNDVVSLILAYRE